MADKKVTVTIGSTISVNPDPIQAKKNQDKVQWESTTGQFTIDLPGHTITYKQEGQKYIGLSGDFSTVGTLKYSVSASGKPVLDPEVEVVP